MYPLFGCMKEIEWKVEVKRCHWIESNDSLFYTICVDWFSFGFCWWIRTSFQFRTEEVRWRAISTSDLDGTVHGLASCGIHSEELLTSTHFTCDTDKNITQKSTRVVTLWTEHWTLHTEHERKLNRTLTFYKEWRAISFELFFIFFCFILLFFLPFWKSSVFLYILFSFTAK